MLLQPLYCDWQNEEYLALLGEREGEREQLARQFRQGEQQAQQLHLELERRQAQRQQEQARREAQRQQQQALRKARERVQQQQEEQEEQRWLMQQAWEAQWQRVEQRWLMQQALEAQWQRVDQLNPHWEQLVQAHLELRQQRQQLQAAGQRDDAVQQRVRRELRAACSTAHAALTAAVKLCAAQRQQAAGLSEADLQAIQEAAGSAAEGVQAYRAAQTQQRLLLQQAAAHALPPWPRAQPAHRQPAAQQARRLPAQQPPPRRP